MIVHSLCLSLSVVSPIHTPLLAYMNGSEASNQTQDCDHQVIDQWCQLRQWFLFISGRVCVWLSRARRELEFSSSQTITVNQCLSAWQIPCAHLQVSASVRACVCLFDLLEVKQYLSTCVCLPDKFRLFISKCLPLCVRVFVYLCVSLFSCSCVLECFCVSV